MSSTTQRYAAWKKAPPTVKDLGSENLREWHRLRKHDADGIGENDAKADGSDHEYLMIVIQAAENQSFDDKADEERDRADDDDQGHGRKFETIGNHEPKKCSRHENLALREIDHSH